MSLIFSTCLFAKEQIRSSLDLGHDLLAIEYSRDANAPLLLTAISHKETSIAVAGIKTAGKIGAFNSLPQNVLDVLLSRVSDKNSSIRAQVAYTFAAYRSFTPNEIAISRIAILRQFEKETSDLAKSRQVFALASFANYDDLPMLMKLARESKKKLVRLSAMMAVYEFGWKAMIAKKNIRADDELLSYIFNWLTSSKSADTEVGAQVVYSLALSDSDIPNRPIAVELVMAAANAKLDRSKNWLFLSLSSKVEGAKEILLAAADHPESTVRASFAAFVAPYMIDKVLVTKVLIKLLTDTQETVRFAATMGLISLSKHSEPKVIMRELYQDLILIYNNLNYSGTKSNLLRLLVTLDSKKSKSLVKSELSSRNDFVKGNALFHWSSYPDSTEQVEIIEALSSRHPYRISQAFKSIEIMGESKLQSNTRDKLIELVSLADPNAIEGISKISTWPSLATSLAIALAKAYPVQMTAPSALHMPALISSLGNTKTKDHLNLIVDALKSKDIETVKAAKSAYKNITGKEDLTPIPKVSQVTSRIPTPSEVSEALSYFYRFVFSSGRSFTIELNAETPISAVEFLRLVKKGFYNDTITDWVWPSYILTLGDDGLGASGVGSDSFRDELVLPFDHQRGSISFVGRGQADHNTGKILINQNYRFYDARQINYHSSFGKIVSGIKWLNQAFQHEKLIRIEMLAK